MAITGIIVPIIVTLILHKRFKKNKYVFFERKLTQINTQKVTDFENVRITYENTEVYNYLNYLSGTVIMLGEKDVTPSDIFTPITFILDKDLGCWKSFNVLDTNTLLQYEVLTDLNKTSIKTDLIKVNDTISFEAYFTSENTNYTISHRIAEIQNSVLILKESSQSTYISYAIVSSLVIFFYSVILFLYPFGISNSKINSDKNISKTEYYYEEKPLINRLDSIEKNLFNYDYLIYVNNVALKNDSVFRKNYDLNMGKNKDVFYDQKYEDYYSIMNKKNKIFIDLNLNNKFRENIKYAINDSISISFSKNSYGSYEKSKGTDYFKYFIVFVFFVIYSIAIRFFILSIVKIYYFYKINKLFRRH
ncbi:hypothetical protein [Myroides sp. N17-2]|uniref:hypothetical protein n=1 Tax=Myroides sp. N17-2 TaxID=2030799 RepID=UPI0013047770|nr:hypothetical protein [Myroides sp. N17-2]